jgi:hypothetical protein
MTVYAHRVVASTTRQGDPVIRTPRALRRAPFLVALVLVAAVLVARRDAAAQSAADAPGASPEVATKQAASFEIYSGNHRLGTEKFRVYAMADTLIMMSDVTLDGASPGSELPLTKSAAFRQRAFDSYPVAFVAETKQRRDTSRVDRVVCAFMDTVAMVTIDRADRGRVESVGLPPGRLYILEPGVYLQMQVLLADFLARGQDERKQGVLVPSLARVFDVQLKRGATEEIVVRGRKIKTQRVEMSDGLTTFDGWLDAEGRMWRLTAVGQPLVVVRGPDVTTKGAPARRAPAKHSGATRAGTQKTG